MANGKTKQITALALIIAAGGWLYWFFTPHVPALDERPYEAAGEKLASEAVRLLGSGGRVIVVVRDTSPFKIRAQEAMNAAFIATLKKSGQSPAVTHKIKLDPLRAIVFSGEDFAAALKGAQETDVLISFIGVPLLTEAQTARAGARRPKVLALCPLGSTPATELRRVFEQSILHGAVVLRLDSSPHFGGLGKQEAFARTFAWITPGNLAELDQITLRN